MPGRQNAVWVGIFVIAGLLLFAVGLFLIGDRRLLFAEQREIETAFQKVTGLQVGTQVRVAGMNAGEVLRMDLPAVPSQPFVVRLRIREDLSHLVRTDSRASIQTDGIVGNALIQVSPGTDAAHTVASGGRIEGVEPVEFSDVIAKASDTLATFNDMVVKISPQVTVTLDRLNETVDGVNDVVDDVGVGVREVTIEAKRSIVTTNRMLDDVSAVVASVRRGEGTVGKLLTDDALYADMRMVSSRAAAGVEQFRATSEEVRTGVTRLLRPAGPIDSVLSDVQGAAAAAEEVVSDLAETTEAFKRNFFVRGFFHDRGYFDIDALSPLEYRRFSDATDERTSRRIWLDAAVLFTKNEEGEERLSAEGRRRLDLAMGTLLEYRRDGALIVEGYATGESTNAQFLLSDARARLVRDHLVRRFRRDSSITGAIGLGGDARDAPSGAAQWDGVALALHLPK